MRRRNCREDGHTIVEATIIYPITILLVFVMIYAGLMVCYRANLQASLEEALIYCKNENIDTYIEALSEWEHDQNTDGVIGNKSKIEKKESEVKMLNPYRSMKLEKSTISKLFKDSYGMLFFSQSLPASDITVTEKDYGIYRKIKLEESMTLKPAMSFSPVGIEDNSVQITATATAVVVNQDATIRDIDFACDMFQQTSIGQSVMGLVDKASEFYEKIKEKLK